VIFPGWGLLMMSFIELMKNYDTQMGVSLVDIKQA